MHQPCLRTGGLFEQVDGLCRGTLMIASWDKLSNNYEFIDGSLKYSE